MAKKNRMTVQEYKTALIESLIPFKKRELERTDEFLRTYYAAIHSTEMSDEDKEAIFSQCDNFESIGGKTVTAHEYSRYLEREIDRLEAEALPTDKKFFNCHLYSDINPYYCVNELTPNKVEVVRLFPKAGPNADGTGHQDWVFDKPDNPDDFKKTLIRHKNGLFYEVGDRSCPYTVSKEPIHYYDWSF